MRKSRLLSFLPFIALAAIMTLACASLQQLIPGTPTPTPTITLTPTITRTPTPTSPPTATPNLAVTQQYEAFFSLVQEYFDEGNIPSLDGEYVQLDDYADELASEGNYRWSKAGLRFRDFIIKTHITMSTANKPSKSTGCGITFRSYGEFANVVFIQQNGTVYYATNNQKFEDRYFGTVDNPAELDFIFIAIDKKLRVIIDGKTVLDYETFLPTYDGDIGFTVISGSNEDYGSRCEFKDSELWIIK